MKCKKCVLIPLGLGTGALFLYLLLRPAKAEAAKPPLPRELDFIEEVARHYYSERYKADIPQVTASQIALSVMEWTEKRNLDLFSSLAIIAQESYFNRYAFGLNNERGLWQLSDIALAELARIYKISIDRTRIFEVDYNTELGTLFYLYVVGLAKGNRREAIARYHRTTRYWEAWDYADEVLKKRAEIMRMYEEFIQR